MKVRKKQLFLKNTENRDIKINDIGIKIRSGQTIDVFKNNPYLTIDQVNESLTSGELKGKVDSGSLIRLNRMVKRTPHNINHMKDNATNAVSRVKSSVVIEPVELDVLSDDDDSFDNFADYGFDEDVVNIDKDNGAIVISPKVDEEECDFEEIKTEVTTDGSTFFVDYQKDE